MFSSLKPINIILFNTYIIALIYLLMTWNYVSCGTSSGYWELFFYLILFARLFIDELENNSKISENLALILMTSSSVICLFALSTYELLKIHDNP